MAAQKTLVERLRSEAKAAGSEVLVLSGGDVNTGVPESDLQDAEPDFMAMNSIRYDAMAVGNHEFDNPLTILEKQRQWAQFPMISANIYDKTSGKRYFDPYKVFKLESGLKVAVLGLTTEDTAQLVDPNNVQTLEFRDPTTEAANLGKQIRDNKEANLVLAITHMGHYENGQHGSNAPGDVEWPVRCRQAPWTPSSVVTPRTRSAWSRAPRTSTPTSSRATTASRISRTAPGSCRLTSGASMWVVPSLTIRMAS